MHEFLVELVAAIVPWTEAVGIAIVMWGAIEGLVKLLGRVRSVLGSTTQPIPISRIRLAIGEKSRWGWIFSGRRHYSSHHYFQLGIARHSRRYSDNSHHHRVFPQPGYQGIC